MRPEGSVRNRLRTHRVRLGLSQQDLALAAGVTRQTIGAIEAGGGAPTAGVALRLARALACRVEDLFWLEDDLPVVSAAPGAGASPQPGTRVTLIRNGKHWISTPLRGEDAFRPELLPCDGIVEHAEADGGVRVRLFEEPEAFERTVRLTGCIPVLSLWARAAERWRPGLRVHWTFANSTEALTALAARRAHGAAIHLSGPDCESAAQEHITRLCPGVQVVLVQLGVWDEGLLVAPGNSKGLRRAADLARPDVRILNREPGAGSRFLLEELLKADGVPRRLVRGFGDEAHSHLAVAVAVAAGTVDVGISSACVAGAYGLGFVPLRRVRCDVAFRREDLGREPIRQLLGTLDQRWIRAQFQAVGGYDTGRTGEVAAEFGGPER